MPHRFHRLLPLLAGLLTAAPAAPAAAQGLVVPDSPRIVPPRPGPIRPVPPVRALSVTSQTVKLDVANGAAKVSVEQLFRNPNSFPVEGTYLFPLPEGATISAFRMQIDREPIQGRLLSAEEARRIYESYVRRNIDPAILEYVGRNAFQARIFPIPPHGERRISLEYSQAPRFSAGIYQFVYPLNSERLTGETIGSLSIDCAIRSDPPLRAVYSPTHEIQVRRDGEHRARATYEGQDVRANRDFLLYYTVSEKEFGLSALAHRRAGEAGYAMLMLAPKQSVARGDVQPKDIVFVFDTSGSMQGEKIEQARSALRTLIGALNDRDRFNIVRFSSTADRFRETVVPATPENRAAARAFVEEFRAVGGTAIDDALQAGLASIPKPEERPGRAPFLVFMTDGLPTIGVTEPDRILENARKAVPPDLRFFSFGVGADVNTLLLDRLARENRGDSDYVVAGEDLETKIGGFYAKIADPVLSDVKLAVEGVRLRDVYPPRIPDLFAGTQLLVLGRYEGAGRVTVTLTGTLSGKPQRYTYELTLPEREPGQEFLPSLWAGRRIGFLLEEIRLRGETRELKDEVIRLSKEHGIVTPYTSYLVEEPGMLPPGVLRLEGESLGRDGFARGGGGLGGGRGGFAGAPGGPRGPGGASTALARPEARLQAASGIDAVEASRRLRALRERGAADSLDVEVRRTVAGRAFRFEKGAWVDETLKPGAKPLAIRYGSEAYFKLLRARTEWAKVLALGRSVTFRTGKTAVVTIAEKGKEDLTAAELAALEE